MILGDGGRVLAGRFGDARQKRRFVGVSGGERLDGLVEIELGSRREAISSVAEVDEAGVTRKQLFFRPALGAVALLHLAFEPQGETNDLYLQEELLGGKHPDDEGQQARENARVLERIVIFRAGALLQEVAAHQLLSDRRAALWKYVRALRAMIAIRTRYTRG